MDVDLFMCGGCRVLRNSISGTVHSKKDDAFRYPWVGASFYGNPKDTAEFITRTLEKTVSNFSNNPSKTPFMLELLDWQSVPYYPLVDEFEIVKLYPGGSSSFSCLADAMCDTKVLTHAGDEGGYERVLIKGIS